MPSHVEVTPVEGMIQDLFPPEVITVTASPDMWDGRLFPEEEACIQRAVPKRRREFTAGRLCARKALSILGVEGFPLMMGSDRLPLWPAGVIGSISHSDGYCGVAMARLGTIASLGLDVEKADPLKTDTIALIAAERELSQRDRFPGLTIGEVAKILFSAKEAAFKCWYPLGRILLDFRDVEVTLDPASGGFTARFLKGGGSLPASAELTGRFATSVSHVFAGVTLTTSGLSASSR